MGDFLTYLLVSLVAFVITALLAPTPRVQNAKPQVLGDFNFPRIAEGAPVPLLWGRVRVRGVNILWYGDLSSRPIQVRVGREGLWGSGIYQTAGYQYRLGLHIALCLVNSLSPNRLGATFHKIWFGERIAWEGESSADADGQRITIDAPDLFCGYRRGGGVGGDVSLYSGSHEQSANAYLGALADGPDPDFNYRGLVRMVFEQFYVGERVNVPPISVEVSQQPEAASLYEAGIPDTHGDDLPAATRPDGYPDYSGEPPGEPAANADQAARDAYENYRSVTSMAGDANPAEVLYDILTNPWGRLGLPISLVDRASFREAARVLREEEHGLSLKIEAPNDARDIIREILDQVNGALYEEPERNKITLKLIRREDFLNAAGETLESVTPFDESDVLEVTSFSTSNWNETYNQVRVTYIDRLDNYKEKSVLAQDLSNIENQDRIRSTDFKYPGISNEFLASRVATRELMAISTPLIKCRLLLNRRGADLRPGDPIKFSWSDYNLTDVVLRVQTVDLGELDNGRVAIDCIQSPYFDNSSIFDYPGQSSFLPPEIAPVPITRFNVFEAPAFFRRQRLVLQGQAYDPQQDNLVYMAVNPGGLTSVFNTARVDEDTREATGSPYLLGLTQARYQGSGIYGAYLAGVWRSGAFVSTRLPLTGNDDVAVHTTDFNLPLLNLLEDAQGNARTRAQAQSDIREGRNLFLINEEIMAFEGYTAMPDDDLVILHGVHRALLDTVRAEHGYGLATSPDGTDPTSPVWFLSNLDYTNTIIGLSLNIGGQRLRPAEGETVRIAPSGGFIEADFDGAESIPVPKRSRSARVPPLIYYSSGVPLMGNSIRRPKNQSGDSAYRLLTTVSVGFKSSSALLLESDYSSNRPWNIPFPFDSRTQGPIIFMYRHGNQWYARGHERAAFSYPSGYLFNENRLINLHLDTVNAIRNAPGATTLQFFGYLCGLNADALAALPSSHTAFFNSPIDSASDRTPDMQRVLPISDSLREDLLDRLSTSLYAEPLTVIYE